MSASAVDCLCLAGPTASGKSAAALAIAAALAPRHAVEIVSVDSALVYRGMDIGTAKPDGAERAAVPHHLIDIADPAQSFVSGLPYADNVEVLIDKDPASRLASWLAGKTDFAPEYQQCVRWLELPLAKQRKPGLQTAEYAWFTSGSLGIKLATAPVRGHPRAAGAVAGHQPGRDLRVPRLLPGATGCPTRPSRPPTPSGRFPSTSSAPRAASSTSSTSPRPRSCWPRPASRRASRPRWRRPATGYGPDFNDSVAITVKNWKEAGIDAAAAAQGVRGVHLQHHLRQVRPDVPRAARRLDRSRGVLLPGLHAGPDRSTSWA